MEQEPPYDLYGIEDDFEEQFADELEVLAELEAEASQAPRRKVSELRSRKRTFEEALSAGDSVKGSSAVGSQPLLKKPSQSQLLPKQIVDNIGLTHKELQCPAENTGSPQNRLLQESSAAQTPKPKRRRLDAMKKLDFGMMDGTAVKNKPEEEAAQFSLEADSESQDIRIPRFPEGVEESGLFPLHATSPEENARKKILKRPPILEDYISVTSSSGTRVFMIVKEDQATAELCSSSGQNKFRPLHLLGVPFSYLKEQVMEERQRQMRESLQDLKVILNRCLDEAEVCAEVPEASESEEGGAQGQSGEGAPSSLWVDLFTPRHYLELLSDDYTNRCLLKWLKLWDMVVFGREKPVKKARPKSEAHPPFRYLKEHQSKWKTKAQLTEDALEAELDHQNRPKYKVALLCGPPGLGKTTLAHVIAKHAGYNVVEMNASDDRSPDIFKTRIEAATQMKSVLGADEKPNCLIIDEIDGAPTASINVLLSIVNWKAVEKESEGGAGGSSGKKKRREGGLLLRPIICVCNDQYVPSLRLLRQQAFLLNFPSTAPSRLVQRLHEIATKQGMKADIGALMALCEKAENDIRSCINTLQFLHSRGKKELSVRTVQATKVGLKDQNKGLFSIWQAIFQLPKVHRQRIGFDPSIPGHTLASGSDDLLGPAAGRASLNPMAQRFQHILHLSTSSGEHEKLAQGLYDNFLNTKVKDSNFDSVCVALDWLGFSDLVNRTILHGQNFQLMRYLPFLPVAFHLLFAASNVPKLAYPHSQQEAHARLTQMQNLVASLISGIAPNSRGRTTPQSLVLEALGLLLEIISPKLRPVNTQLYSQKEKQQLAELISTMLAYNLTYLQERTPDGQYIYKLDPNVEEVCRFPDLPARKPLTYQAKQLIAREIELEKMRRTEAVLCSRNTGQQDPGAGLIPPENSLKAKTLLPKPTVRNHEQRLEQIVKRATFDEKPETDFFGRIIVKKKTSPSSDNEIPEKNTLGKKIGKAVGESDIWFRFNEGVSNAVRRNIYIKDLL